MTGTKVTENLSVSPQITIDMIDELKAQGFTQIICNRPDGESMDQTPYDDIAKRANELGLKIIHQPITPPTLTPESAQIFAELLANGEKTFAYCRTGTRCISLWALGELAKNIPPEAIIAHGQNCGYDLSGIVGKYS